MTAEKILAVMAATAGVLMGLGPLLQAARVHRLRHADDVSPAWLAVIVGGALVWLAYGVVIGNLAIIVPNVAGAICASFTLAVVLVVRRRTRAGTRERVVP